MKISCFGSPRVRGTISVFIFLLSFFVVIVHAPKGLSTLAAAARATSTGASSSADGSEAAYSAAALAAAGLAAVAAKVWTGTGAHTPVVPRHMQPGSNRTGGPQKKGAPAASPIKMGDYEDVSSEGKEVTGAYGCVSDASARDTLRYVGISLKFRYAGYVSNI